MSYHWFIVHHFHAIILQKVDQSDKVKCIFCQGTLYSWKKTDVPDKEHKKKFPTCPFILNLNVGMYNFLLITWIKIIDNRCLSILIIYTNIYLYL